MSNGYARLLNSCKTEDLVCEKTGILPKNHFGGRPGRATMDSVHLMIKLVEDAWRKGEVASLVKAPWRVMPRHKLRYKYNVPV